MEKKIYTATAGCTEQSGEQKRREDGMWFIGEGQPGPGKRFSCPGGPAKRFRTQAADGTKLPGTREAASDVEQQAAGAGKKEEGEKDRVPRCPNEVQGGVQGSGKEADRRRERDGLTT